MNSNVQHKVKNYGLEAPDRKSALEALSQVVGRKEAVALWKSVCQHFSIDENTERTSDLTTIFQTMSMKEGAASIVGRSLLIRMKTYQLLLKNMERDQEIPETDLVATPVNS